MDVSTSLDDWYHTSEIIPDVLGAIMSEHHEQSLVIQWAELNVSRYPELACLFAVPNAGRRGWQVAARMKKEGLRSGVPDLCLPVARGGYGALFVEMKRLVPRETKTKGTRFAKTKETENQLAWRDRLTDAGNLVVTCWTADEAQNVIEAYLKGNYKRVAA